MTSSEVQPEWQESIYSELHQIAKGALAKETPGHSLQPTLLVNDAYLKLLAQKNVVGKDRSFVLAAGAKIIRRLLVDYARKRKSAKRGGSAGRGHPLLLEIEVPGGRFELVELHEALESLEKVNPRAAKVVEQKYFGGLTGDEIADIHGVSRRTVQDDWTFAKAWLYRELS